MKNFEKNEHELNIINQFSIRIKTYNHAANWMLAPDLIKAHVDILGKTNQTKKCLELCCGTGITGKALLDAGWDMTGIDLTKEMSAVANELFPALVGNVESMPFVDHCFDAAVIRQAYMLLNGPKALKEIHRILKPDGEFVLTQSVPFGPLDDEHYQKVQWARHIHMTKYYNTFELINELEENGFEVIEKTFLSVEESIDKWTSSAPELSNEIRTKIYDLIANAPEGYNKARNVHRRNDELFENWNWVLIKARDKKT
jgi:ubiquinone/menaquinone biosynthesis C-methylase UbiE